MYLEANIEDIGTNGITIKIEGEEYEITDNFKKTLAAEFKISNKQNLQTIIQQSKKSIPKNVKIYIVGNKAYSAFDVSILPPPVDDVRSMVTCLENKYTIHGMSNKYCTRLIILGNNHNSIDNNHKHLNYDIGVYTEIPHDGSRNLCIASATERLSSGARAIIRCKESKIDQSKVKMPILDIYKMIETAVETNNNNSREATLVRLKSALDTEASLNEVVKANNIIASHSYNTRLLDPLRIDEILDRYNLDTIQDRPIQWRKNARTPFSRIEIFNYLSEVGTRCFKSSKRHEIISEAGKFLSSVGDLEHLAPYTYWEDYSNSLNEESIFSSSM